MVDEMYLHKAVQYQAGEYVGADEEGNLFQGIVAFMGCRIEAVYTICCSSYI